MHGNILTQRINYFEINAYKDYCRLIDHTPFLDTINDGPWELSGIEAMTIFTSDGSSFSGNPGRVLELRPKGMKWGNRKNTDYLYSNSSEVETIRLEPYFKKNNTFVTTKQKHLTNHYGNPLSEFATHIFERSVTLNDDYLSIRVSKYSKSRRLNGRFFRKHSYSYGIKFNLKTGNFITYFRNGNKKTSTGTIRQNSFSHLSEILRSLFTIEPCSKDSRNFKELLKTIKEDLSLNEFIKVVYHSVCSLLHPTDQNQLTDSKKAAVDKIENLFLDLFIKAKKIKVPNGDYKHYFCNWYPTKKFLLKNDNKLIAAIVDRMGIKSKSLVKLLHKEPNIDLSNLGMLTKFFGIDDIHKFLPNIDKRIILRAKDEENILGTFSNGYNALNNLKQYNLSSGEKSRLLKLLNSFFDATEDNRLPRQTYSLIRSELSEINDHLSMLEKIKVYLPDMELKAQNFRDFHHEHIEYAKIQRSINKGYNIQYTFEKRLISYIERPIVGHTVVDDVMIATSYYPVLLKHEGQYSEEGAHMHHCVATYADSERSVIISLREDSPEGHERITCEFNLSKELVQAKYFCNAPPPERFAKVLEELCHRIENYSGSIKSTGKERVPLVINGVQINVPEREKDTFQLLFEHINGREF